MVTFTMRAKGPVMLDIPDGLERSREGSIHIIPFTVITVTQDEWEHIKGLPSYVGRFLVQPKPVASPALVAACAAVEAAAKTVKKNAAPAPNKDPLPPTKKDPLPKDKMVDTEGKQVKL